jgi:hypothetical protein
MRLLGLDTAFQLRPTRAAAFGWLGVQQPIAEQRHPDQPG